MKPLLLAVTLILPALAFSLTLQEDDLVFDDVGEPGGYGLPIFSTDEHSDHERKHDKLRDKKHDVERLWGIPDTSVVIGHVFKMRILKQAFSGNVDHFEARGVNGQRLAQWVDWDEAASTLVGVPSKKDLGIHRITIKAFGRHGDVAKDTFTVNVVAEKKDEIVHRDGKTHCDESEDQTLLTIVLDAKFDSLKPADRANAIENLAGFLGLHTSAFSMHPFTNKETSSPDASVILSGPGNVKRRHEKHSTAIQWQVGCDGRLWRHQTDLVRQLREQAKDGTLAEVLQQPVLLWRIKTDSSSLLRNRRETGSGDFATNYEDDDYEDYTYDEDGEEGEGEDENETVTEQPIERPHRHHHGDKIDPSIEEDIDVDELLPIPRSFTPPESMPPTTTTSTSTTTSTPPLTTVPPTTVLSTTTTTQVPSTTVLTTSSTTTTTTTTPASTTTSTTTTTTESWKPETEETENEKIDPMSITVPTTLAETTIIQSNTTILQSTSSTNAISTSATAIKSVPETTVVYNQSTLSQETTEQRTEIPTTVQPQTTLIVTTTSTTTTTPAPSTTTEQLIIPEVIPEVEEKIEQKQLNFPPREDNVLQKQQVTAGKPLSFVIPENTFVDFEDGNTRKLSLSLYWQRNPIRPEHWLQFNRNTQEVYGLPLENATSKWDYELVAMDSEGLNVTTSLDVHVQQHKITRAFNHEFSIYLKLNKPSEFPTNVDWELKLLRSLAELYGDQNTDQITVRSIDMNGDQAIFTWSNDSIPRSSVCPKQEIDKLLHVLIANEIEEPSIALQDILAPEMKVYRVIYRGSKQCEDHNVPTIPSVVTQEPKINQPPVSRNQVDHLNATVGQLLVFTVPDDSFYDNEDQGTRNMKLSLMTSSRTPIPETDWLQFDSKNQQFYGVPMAEDIGRKQYQLIVTDRGGASFTDGLVADVRSTTTTPSEYNMKFSMTTLTPYNSIAHSATQKRKFIEKLAELFHDKDTSSIVLNNITNMTNSTVVSWYNRTLAISSCPHKAIMDLQNLIVKEKRLTERVNSVMGPDFQVEQISMDPIGHCSGELTGVLSPSVIPPQEDTTSVGKSTDDLIITFIVPAIIIAAMLILASIIACILYRRRRSGKMSVSEQDDERQSFRNKGIPVIFQDELDEKPDPGNKSPVILKEEKPPLPPPEYQKTEDGADVPMLQSENSEEPYQPPPPFATNRDNNRQNRPKPTPTYRKPPPYVPP